jgi:hypothetical protein
VRKLSISLPSIYGTALLRTLKNIRDATRCDYEVILVSPWKPVVDGIDDRIIWVEEQEGTGTGCNAGHAAALAHMTGEFCLPWVDDHFLADGWDVEALRDYEDRERVFHAAGRHRGKPFSLGLHHAWPHHVGTCFGRFYPYFPLIRRKYVERLGWFDPAYKQGFADSDLAMRVWSAGGRCEWSDRALIVVHHDDDRKNGAMFAPSDMDLYIERWAPKYGSDWKTDHLRDFNIDVEPNWVPSVVSDRTICFDGPGFRDVVMAHGWRPEGTPAYPVTAA